MTVLVKNEETGTVEDRTMDTWHDAVVTHYTKLGLYQRATAVKQQVYAFGEAGELAVDGVLKNNLEEVKDGIGDVMICVINWAWLECVDFVRAYNLMLEVKASEDVELDCLRLGTIIDNLNGRESIIILLEALNRIAKFYDLDLLECLGHSYNVVFNRKVKPLNGTLVKEDDWHKYPQLECVAIL